MTAKKIISNLLLAFVLVSIGFAIGKEAGLRSVRRPAEAARPASATQPAGSDKVIVYYMHQTFRCVTCNQIEAMTADLVKTDFAKELSDGRLEWKRENFQENEDLARRYNVASSSVVVVQVRDGKEVAHQTLDKVWELVGKRDEFAAYVGGTIRAYTNGEVR